MRFRLAAKRSQVTRSLADHKLLTRRLTQASDDNMGFGLRSSWDFLISIHTWLRLVAPVAQVKVCITFLSVETSQSGIAFGKPQQGFSTPAGEKSCSRTNIWYHMYSAVQDQCRRVLYIPRVLSSPCRDIQFLNSHTSDSGRVRLFLTALDPRTDPAPYPIEMFHCCFIRPDID